MSRLPVRAGDITMKEERDAKTKKGIIITAVIVGGLAVFFYVLFIALRI
jgi:hypothetical protein